MNPAAVATRRERLGGQYFSPEGLASQRAKRTQVCPRGHSYSDHGVRYADGVVRCRPCESQRREAARPQGLIPNGASSRSLAAIRASETKRERYGTSLCSEEYLEKKRAHAARIGRARGQVFHCKRGHAFSKANTHQYVRPNGQVVRICRACRSIQKKGRPAWVEQNGVRINVTAHDRFFRRRARQLKTAMLEAHPDKGGTSRKFIEARKRYAAFLHSEARWYAAHGVTVPSLKRSEAKAA